jgi:hypothetical protein
MAIDAEIHEKVCDLHRKNRRRYLPDTYVSEVTGVPVTIVKVVASTKRFFASRQRSDGHMERRFIGTSAQYDKCMRRLRNNTAKRQQCLV